MKKQKIFLVAKILFALFAVFVIGFYMFRDTVLQQTIAKVSHEMAVDYNSTFTIKKASFDGLSGLNLTEIILVPKNADTLLRIQKLKTSVNLLRLVMGDVQLGTLEIQNGFVQLIKKGKTGNYDAFLKKDTQTEIRVEKRDYAQFAYNIISKALNLVPTDMILDNLSFRLNDNGKKATINFQKLLLVSKQLEASIKVQTNTISQRWKIKGFADPRNKKTDIRFVNIDTGAIKMPYLDERFNLKSSFDSIRLTAAQRFN